VWGRYTWSLGGLARSSTILWMRVVQPVGSMSNVLATLLEHGGLERPSSACMSLACRSHTVWVLYEASTIAPQRQYNRSNLEKHRGEVAANFGGGWALKAESCTHVETVCGVVHLVLRRALYEFRRSLMPVVQNVGWVKPCWRHFWSMMGAWRPSSACMRVSCL
jgi:hypothetical protein